VSLEKKGTDPFRDLWPSEFRQFQEGIESTKRRLADGAATDRLNSAMANATGLDGARSLSGWADQQKELLEYVSQDTRQKLNSRINAKMGEFLEPLLREEADATGSLGEGADAVVAGNKWYRHLNATYGFAAGHPAFQAAIKQFQGRRTADLSAAEPTIIAEIEEQSSEKAVDNTRNNYLCVPGDGDTAAAAAIAAAANARKSAIAWEREKTRYSERELALMNKDGRGVISVPANYEPPTAQEITLATLRAFASTGGEVLSANTATFTPMRNFKNFAYRIQIQNVELNNLEHPDQSPCQPAGAGGYVCHYRLSKTVAIPNFAGSSQNPLLKLNEVLIRASEQAQKLNEPELKKVRFVLTPTGWRAPELESEVATLSFDLP
jgi:hypothetical protein